MCRVSDCQIVTPDKCLILGLRPFAVAPTSRTDIEIRFGMRAEQQAEVGGSVDGIRLSVGRLPLGGRRR